MLEPLNAGRRSPEPRATETLTKTVEGLVSLLGNCEYALVITDGKDTQLSVRGDTTKIIGMLEIAKYGILNKQ